MRDDSGTLGFFALDAITSEGLQSPNAPSSIFSNSNHNDVGNSGDDKSINNNNNNNNNSCSSNNNNNNNNNVNQSNGTDSNGCSIGNDTSCSTSNGVVGGTTIVLDENDSVLPCDLPDHHVWGKMSVATSGNKKRKKADTKPQSQINKCLNEKRRREQENIFIEELAELISVTFADMSSFSVKPDKCAILQETVIQIRNIKQQQQQHEYNQQQQSNQGVVSSDDIQQGEVSSSKPTVLSNDVFGPLLLEALEGFAFLLNHEGKIEYVTDNVPNFIRFTKDELIGSSIFGIIHPNDQGRFSSVLLPTSVTNWTQTGSGPTNPQSKNRSTFNCRLLIKNPNDDTDEPNADDKERLYENVQISYTSLKGDGSSSGNSGSGSSSGGGGAGDVSSECAEMSPGLICVARRIPSTDKHLSQPIEQFTTKLDTSGRIIAIDTSGSSSTYSLYLNKDLMGKLIQELCHHQDLPKVTAHLKDILSGRQTMSKIFRFKVSSDKFIQVQTKSRLFKSAEGDFIMATHSIIGDNDVCQMIETSPHAQQLTSASSHGGGPMLNTLNGRQPSVTTPESSSTALMFSNNSDYQSFDMPCENDPYHNPTYDMDGERSAWHDRPESRHSLTSTASPSNQYCQASPVTNPPPTPFSSLPFSPVDADSKKEGNGAGNAGAAGGGGGAGARSGTTPEMMMNDAGTEIDSSHRLRNLLTNKKNSVDEDANNRSRLVESRLCHEDNVDLVNDACSNTGQKKGIPSTPTSENQMLLKLLNSKRPENEEPEKHELLQQLLCNNDDENKHRLLLDQQDINQVTQRRHNEETILQGLGIGFSTPTSPPSGELGRARKRPSEEAGDGNVPAKKLPGVLDSIPPPPQQPTTVLPNRSNLQERNKMLAQLLAKEPSTPNIIPHVPSSIIYATPQDRLPKISVGSGTRPSQSAGTFVQAHLQQNAVRIGSQMHHQSTTLTSNLLNGLLLQQSQHPQPGQALAQYQSMRNNAVWDSHSSPHFGSQPDQELTAILDQLFDNVPEAVITAKDTTIIMNVIDALQSPENSAEIVSGVNSVTMNNPEDNSDQEKAVISAITRSFMQCEQSTNIKRMQNIPQQMVLQQQHVPQQTLQPSPQVGQPSSMQPNLNQMVPQSFPTPSMYAQRGQTRVVMHQNMAGSMQPRPMAPQYTVGASNTQFAVQNQSNMINAKYLQNQQKRLLQRQQQQQLLIPSSATASSQNPANLQSMDMCNGPPPNVSLQRSTSLTSESPNAQQLSPGGNAAFGNPMLSSPQQISPSQRQQPLASPYSPHQQQSFPTLNNFGGTPPQPSPTQPQGARLSPSNLSPFQAQLSPRVSQPQPQSYSSSSVMTSQSAQSISQPQGVWSSQQVSQQQQQQTQQQQQQMVNSRLNMQQQQNPLLDARLSGAVYSTNNRALFPQQQQHPQKTQQPPQSPQLPQIRGLPSPGARQSPFPPDVLQSPGTNYAVTSQQQQQQQYRLPARSIGGLTSNASIPASPVPSGNNCMRGYSSPMSNPLVMKDTSQSNPSHLQSPLYPPMSMYSHPYNYPGPGASGPALGPGDQSLLMYGDNRSRMPHSGGGNSLSNNSGNTAGSEYVRQELRAKVDARIGGRLPPTVGVGGGGAAVDLEALGLTFEDSDGAKWNNSGGDLTDGTSSAALSIRTGFGDVMRSNAGTNSNAMNNIASVNSAGEKSSLLQKLLSE